MKNFLCVQLWVTWTATFYFYFGKKLIYFSEGSTLPQCLKMTLKVIWILSTFAPKSTRVHVLFWPLCIVVKWDTLGWFSNSVQWKATTVTNAWIETGRKKCWNLFLIFQCKVGVKRLKKNFTWKFTPIVLFFNTRVEITTVEYAHLHLVVYETWKSL